MSAFDPATAIGLMSGTSLDGIDAALLTTDGARVVTPGESLSMRYKPKLRDAIRRLLGSEDREAAREVERKLTGVHAKLVARLLDEAGLKPGDVRIIGFHGHTVTHRPPVNGSAGWTWQIGDGAALAAETGIPVVNDLRSADMVAGGHGAPLVPVYQAALANAAELPAAVLNLGGVGNVTWIGEGAPNSLVAFDTGPGNALIDDWIARHTGKRRDKNGKRAALGTVDGGRLAAMLEHPYFDVPPPKSLDRLDFNLDHVDGLGIEDGAATLTRFTAETVSRAIRLLPAPPRAWYVTGGGRHNATLMRDLKDVLQAPVQPVEDLGWDGDMLEAQAFAYLAVRSLRGLPLTFPGTTGCRSPVTGGKLWEIPA